MQRIDFMHTLVLSAAGMILKPTAMKANESSSEEMIIHMIYNNTGKSKRMKNAWGLSVWIETADHAVLFDTGGKADILWGNFENAGLNVNKLSHIVISHRHWDHRNGLGFVLEKTSFKPEVLVVEHDLAEFSTAFSQAIVRPVSGPFEIDKGIWTSGELQGTHSGEVLYEQSLILQRENSLVLLTGCSHSGIVEMVEKLHSIFPGKNVSLVAGGFHLIAEEKNDIRDISAKLKKLNIEKIAPSHCTGNKAMDVFARDWGDAFIDLNLGDQYSF